MVLISLAAILSFGIGTVSADPGVLYVNHTSGNDDWDGQYQTWQGSGTIFGPKLTIKNATGTVTSGGTVNVASGTYNENGISINKDVTIVGENKDNTIVNGTDTAGIFVVSGSEYSPRTATFSNLKLANGKSMAGGAIQSNGPNTVMVENCIFQDNVATGSGGGAIYSYGIYSFSNPGQLSISDSTFTNNQANGGTGFGGSGGAVANFWSTLTITNSNFIDNAATGVAPSGGAIHNSAATGTIQFNRFVGNTATTGSAIYSDAVFGSVDATLNWWGSNNDPTALVSGAVTVDPWLVFTATANPSTVNNNDGTSTFVTSTITADFQHDLYGNYYDPFTYGHIPDGLDVTFSNDSLGSVSPLTNTIVNGAASTTFTSGTNLGTSTVTATSEMVPANAYVDIVNTPLVTSIDPVDYAIDMPINKNIIVTFSKAIQAGSSYNNINVLGDINYLGINKSIVGNTLTITPTNYWDSFNTLTIPLDAIAGLSAEFQSHFSTAYGPIVTSVDPVDVAVNIPLNKMITVTFDRLIFEGVNYAGITLIGPSTIGITTNIIDNTLLITPNTYYDPLSNYILTIPYDAIADNLGYNLITDFSSSFTTQLTPTAITVTANPATAYKGNIINLIATLTDAINGLPLQGKTIQFSIAGNLLPATATTDLNGIATLAYTITQNYGTYTILANFLGDTTYAATSNTTNLNVPITPTAITVNPSTGYKGSLIYLIATLTDTAHSIGIQGKNIQFSINGNIGTATTNAQGIATLAYTITQNYGTYTILANFLGDTTYAAANNYNILNVLYVAPPVVTSTSPANNAVNVALNKVIQINFNKAIKYGTNPWFELTNSWGAKPFTTTISGNTLYITTKTLMAIGTQYTVIIHSNSITDSTGTSGLAAPYLFRFTTTSPPIVTSTSPVNNAVNVAINKVIQINFNKAIKYGTNPWIELTNSWGAKPFTMAISGNTLYIATKTLMARGTQYTVILHSNSITDLTGTSGLAAPYLFRFRTV